MFLVVMLLTEIISLLGTTQRSLKCGRHFEYFKTVCIHNNIVLQNLTELVNNRSKGGLRRLIQDRKRTRDFVLQNLLAIPFYDSH